MASLLVIVALIGSSLVSVASPNCPTNANESIAQNDAIAYLKAAANSKSRDAACVDKLLRSLSTDRSAIPILIHYLDFPSPHSIGSYHSSAPILDKFPAVYALATMEGSSEPLLAALSSDKLKAEKQHNAVVAYMLANEEDQIGA